MTSGSRRRGAVLEDAILTAAWDEFAEVGYGNLTMEGVAARAGTGKAVIYRRWPSRAQLMVAAMRRRVVPLAEDVPNTGSLREDLLAVLRRASGRYRELGHDLMHGLIAEFPHVQSEIFEAEPSWTMTILRRAADRGEIDLPRITPRMARLPMDLVRHEMVVTHAPAPESALVEIVDDIVLPLFTR
ncbi:TetR/AcrR family transcriptional regulator [Actinocatenispora comari]|uniref:TetR/AcrR family transcriptional regulator n=1 Tax=Actinocatenispora comari TaxID=2807577 RepID=UPI001A9215FE|nr:TetR/AcrR family transcriptional regulator [Actinocatenispora comari]